MNKKIAFTLAETLIVIGIIGVVAALTLPNLNQSTGNKERVAKLKKIYSNLNDALGRATVVYGPVDTWCANYSGSCQNRHLQRLTEFMKTSKICNNISSCAQSFDNGSNSGGSTYDNNAILADGTMFAINNTSAVGNDGGVIFVDLGVGSGKEGKDVFTFLYGKNKDVYVGDYSGNAYVSCDNKYCHPLTAASWVINFDNMDYLKTSNGTNCPNGTKLTFGGNHSCN